MNPLSPKIFQSVKGDIIAIMYRSLPQKKVDSNKNKLHDHEVPKFFYLSAIKQKHSIDTHIVGVLGLKRRKKEKNVFSKKPDFRKNRIPRIRIRIRWFRSIRGRL